MLFNSIDFAVFLPIVFIVYWFVTNKNLQTQNLLIVVASYVFYGWWDWRFLSLIFFSTVVDYFIGILLSQQQSQTRRKIYLSISVIVNLGFLGFFKYYNFFLENFLAAFTLFGWEIKAHTLGIILPVGISFYTFQALSYTIDVFRRKLEPTRDFIAFAAFVSFFPQLVAGPIERATHLLPQFYYKRDFEMTKAVDGLRQILWGLFKKIVIADNCAEYVNLIFDHPGDYPGSVLISGAFLFAFQIYCDFSGYSDIAVGTSRLFGFNLMQNFAFPYFSRDMGEFWRRWHISLSTWFRDYLYIPLGGNRGTRWESARNIFVVFVASGFWHGAKWTFIVWGVLHAFIVMPSLLWRKTDNIGAVLQRRVISTIRDAWKIGLTFGLTSLAWIFFRAENLGEALKFISGIFSSSLLTMPEGKAFVSLTLHPFHLIGLLFAMMTIEWMGRQQPHALASFGLSWPRVFRHGFYYVLILTIFTLSGAHQDFIYFQF